MHALAIDTTSDYLSLALLKADQPVGSHYALCGVQAAKRIFAEIETLLAGAELTAAELDLIVAAVGPGSFTGTRIGLAVAQTFAHVLARPIVGVDTLQLIAAQTEPGGERGREPVFHALLHCARDEVYHAPFRWAESGPERTGEIGLTVFSELPAIVGEAAVVLRRFDPSSTQGEEVIARLRHAPLRHPFPDGLLLLEQGMLRFRAKPAGPFPPPQPIYLKSEAFRKWRP
jgi:tRNA threonylcarbamoyl adenosine modification protein YeaZ